MNRITHPYRRRTTEQLRVLVWITQHGKAWLDSQRSGHIYRGWVEDALDCLLENPAKRLPKQLWHQMRAIQADIAGYKETPYRPCKDCSSDHSQLYRACPACGRYACSRGPLLEAWPKYLKAQFQQYKAARSKLG